MTLHSNFISYAPIFIILSALYLEVHLLSSDMPTADHRARLYKCLTPSLSKVVSHEQSFWRSPWAFHRECLFSSAMKSTQGVPDKGETSWRVQRFRLHRTRASRVETASLAADRSSGRAAKRAEDRDFVTTEEKKRKKPPSAIFHPTPYKTHKTGEIALKSDTDYPRRPSSEQYTMHINYY